MASRDIVEFKEFVIINYYVGTDIGQAIWEAEKISRTHKKPAMFKFNGTEITVRSEHE